MDPGTHWSANLADDLRRIAAGTHHDPHGVLGGHVTVEDGVFLSGMYDYIGAANHIHNNVHNGVTVVTNAAFPGPGTFESIRSNSIYMNGVLGIDLGNDGRTPNDPCDDDYGANQLQNFPVLAGASHNADGVTIQGTFDSDIDAGYALDFFWNVQCSQIYSCSTCLNQYFIGSITVSSTQIYPDRG